MSKEKTKSITVKVTTDDIQRGIKIDCTACPVALALRRILSVDTWFNVRSEGLFLLHKNDKNGKLIKLPPKIIEFIDKFDSGKTCLPFEIEVGIPVKYL